MALSAPTDGPPPSPATDPAAAQEAGAPASAVQGLIGGQSMMQPGPDLSGIMTLGQKIEEALLTLAQAVPLISPDMDQCKAILINALGKFAASAAGGTGTSPSMPMGTPSPTTTVSQAGAQFPGAMGGGKAF